jgi:hypothetical protein
MRPAAPEPDPEILGEMLGVNDESHSTAGIYFPLLRLALVWAALFSSYWMA